MKRTFVILLVGALAALAAHLGWYQLRRPSFGDDVDGVLAWLRADLNLTDEQFERVKAVHARSSPQLQQLAEQAARMRTELDAFENRRRTDDRIDFLAFARFVEQRRVFDRLCAESTRRLLAAAANEMTPGQRARYLQRFEPAVGPGTGGVN